MFCKNKSTFKDYWPALKSPYLAFSDFEVEGLGSVPRRIDLLPVGQGEGVVAGHGLAGFGEGGAVTLGHGLDLNAHDD